MEPFNIKNKILSIYSDSYDRPNLLTKTIINFSFCLSFTRFTTGYQSFSNYLIRFIRIFKYKISRKKKA